MTTEVLLLAALLTKHFVVDFPLQGKYQWSNKGTYLHPGGLLHAGLHGLFTAVILFAFSPLFLLFGLIDAVLHYHVDWSKMNLNKKLGYEAYHEQFWWLLGLDQYLHHLTYIGLILLM